MDKFSRILKMQLTEAEVIIYLLLQSGMSFREVAERLGMSRTWVENTNETAAHKIKVGEAVGLIDVTQA